MAITNWDIYTIFTPGLSSIKQIVHTFFLSKYDFLTWLSTYVVYIDIKMQRFDEAPP